MEWAHRTVNRLPPEELLPTALLFKERKRERELATKQESVIICKLLTLSIEREGNTCIAKGELWREWVGERERERMRWNSERRVSVRYYAVQWICLLINRVSAESRTSIIFIIIGFPLTLLPLHLLINYFKKIFSFQIFFVWEFPWQIFSPTTVYSSLLLPITFLNSCLYRFQPSFLPSYFNPKSFLPLSTYIVSSNAKNSIVWCGKFSD